MKRKLLFVTASIALLFSEAELYAQNGAGMNYTNPLQNGYSRLRQETGGGILNPLLQNLSNEKAIGLYQSAILPNSMLEINNTPSHTPYPHPNFALGELFRTVGVQDQTNHWRFITGISEKFQVFTTLNAAVANGQRISDQNVTLQATQRDMIFNAGGNIERMRILGQDHNLAGTSPWFATARAGNVGIGTAHPLTMLHIGGEGAAGAGWRQWMDIGTYYASQTGFDNMYVGLRRLAADRHEAIINFGNNPSSNPGNGDNIRFVFTAAPGNGLASGADGFEIARMWTDGQDNGRMGIGDFFTAGTNPANTLEIMASAGSPYWGQPGGTSGLRFTSLTTASTPITNPGTGVLSVDDNGDVIYVDAPLPGGGGVGNYCSDPQNPLTGHYEIPLSNNNYYFTGQGNITRNVVVGVPCGIQPFAKLHVYQTAQNFLFTPTLGISVSGMFQNVANALISYGVMGITTGNSGINVGVYGEASGATQNFAGYFEGDVFVNGGANSGTGYLVASDQQFKTNVNDLNNALSIIEQLEPKSYFLDTLNSYGINFSQKKQYGLIAQSVEQILPELVGEITKPAHYDTLGNIITQEITYKNLNYTALIPVLTKGIQEQQNIIENQNVAIDSLHSVVDDLSNRLTQLENCLGNLLPILCQINNSAIYENNQETQQKLVHTLNVELFDSENIILNQNVPNPFAESTVITYSIPESVQKAQLHFYNMSGQLIKIVDITTRGAGRMNVFGSDLSTGTYTYTLVADGKIVDTKRMVKTQ